MLYIISIKIAQNLYNNVYILLIYQSFYLEYAYLEFLSQL